MALTFEQTWSWIFLVPVACLSFCWYLISIYWLWWMYRFPAAFSSSVLRLLGVRFPAFPKKNEDRCSAIGEIHTTFESYTPVLNTTDPELIKRMIAPGPSMAAKIQKGNGMTGHCAIDSVSSSFIQGNWEYVRRSVTLAFTPGKFIRCAHIMDHCCQELCELLTSKAKKTAFIDTKRVMDDFCMNMILSVMFGINKETSEDCEKMLVEQALKHLKKNLKKNTKETDLNLASFLGATFMLNKGLMKFQEIIKQIIMRRIENNQVKTDFLQLLMESFVSHEKGDGFYEERLVQKDLYNTFLNGKAVSSSDLIAQCLLFFAESYRVTSSVLSLVIYNLAVNPYHQERLRKEVKEILAREKNIDFNSVSKMTYMDQVVCETLRLYCPVSRLQRFAAEDCALGQAELIIRKGSEIVIPLHELHRNSRHYPNPEAFDPERFAPLCWSKRHPYAFIPFGVGPRNCIGMKLALMEIKLSLAHLMKHFRFEKTAKTKIPVELHENQILNEPKEVQLRVEEVTL